MNDTARPPSSPAGDPLSFRLKAVPHDRETVRDIVESTGYFSPAEIEVAVELVNERLGKGPASGYEFVFAETAACTLGYTCFGPIPATQGSFDLYWIAVRRHCRRQGLGSALLTKTEELVRHAGGRRLYADTSGCAQYASTRAFYQAMGYHEEAILRDFFAPDDDKVIFVKVLLTESPTI